MKTHAITGGAGFVAINLISHLLDTGDKVIALDDLSRGTREFWDAFTDNPMFTYGVVDCSESAALQASLVEKANGSQIDEIWHMAANSDIPAGIADPKIDLTKTFMTTFAVLEVMKKLDIGVLNFASSSAIYGDLGPIAIHEDSGPLEPISNYGAMKLASEAQIRAAVEARGFVANIFRFPNVIGIPATHGVILDFVRRLIENPEELVVLGNGTQQKAYLHVEELVEAMLFINQHAAGTYNVYNVGPSDDGIRVSQIAEEVRQAISPSANLHFGSESRGWVGDVPKFQYNTDKLAALGWRPKMGSHEAVRLAVSQIVKQEQG